ncbi:MAG: hypothetical protein OHK0046_50400 [Anaerolineae bacterium]
MKHTSFRSTWLPLGLAALALLILNVGLYTRLAAAPEPPRFAFPYYEDFTTVSQMPYEEFGGDWDIRDASLVQLSTSGYDLTAFIPLEIAPEQPYAFEATLRYLGGSMGGGLLFNAQQTTARQQSHMARFNVDAGQMWLIYGYFGDDSDFIGQGSTLLPLAPNSPDVHRLRVQTTGEVYALYLDNTLLVENVPLYYRGGTVGFISATSQVAFDEIRVDVPMDALVQPPVEVVESTSIPAPTEAAPVDPVVTAETKLVLADAFDNAEAGASLWRPISGSWQFENGVMVQQQTDGFDLSTIYQQPLNQPFTLRATFQHREGSGGGLLFNMPMPDSKSGGHMVRYVDNGDVMAWGYFDADGVFNGQGSAAVTPPGVSVHMLEVQISDNQTYTILLDGAELARDIPVVNPASPGYFGLTASLSRVAFDEVSVFNQDASSAPEMTEVADVTTANIDAEAATGTWLVEGSIITQTDAELTDYIAGTGLAGEQFTISVTLTLPADLPDVGAGLIFHMDGRDDRRLGHMVRFGSGGRELFWGRYDAEGIFTGEGGIPLALPLGEPISLLLVVRAGSFDIHVNGNPVVEAIPIQRSAGWIGLVSFSGPVTFSNVNLQLGQ